MTAFALNTTMKTVVTHLGSGLALDNRGLADVLGVTPRTVERWLRDQAYPQRETRERITRLLEIEQQLQELFNDRAAIRSWLNTDNRYLGGIKPVEALRVGRYDRVEAALEALGSGIFV
jgi:transcriptional regulator with XRE-family HTH domain